MVTLKTNFGDITLELFEDKAPKTVANFISYVEDGFFDNTIFSTHCAHQKFDNLQYDTVGRWVE